MASSGGPPDDGTARPKLSLVPRPATEPEDARTTEIATDEIRTNELPIEAAVRARVLAGRAAMRALASAVARGDEAAAVESWAAVGLNAQHGFSGAPAEVRRWLAGRAPVTWAELYKWDDPWAASALWREGLALRLRDDARRAEGLAMLAEPTLLADVGRDETAAELALRAVSAAAWLSDAGETLLKKLGGIPRTPSLDWLAEQARLDVEVGRQARALPKGVELPAPVRRYLVERSLREGEALSVLADELHEAVRAELDAYVAWADRLERGQPAFVRALSDRLAHLVPKGSRGLAELPAARRERLGAQVRAMAAPRALAVPVVVGGAVAAAVVALAVTGAAMAVALAALALVAAAAMARDYAAYRARVRRPVLEQLVDLEVTQRAAVQWMGDGAAKGARVRAYRWYLARDRPAALVAKLGAVDDGGGG